METKLCHKCAKTKSITEFYKRSGRPCGVQSKCKQCQNSKRASYYKPHEYAKRKFKLTEEDYNTLMEHTNCQLCGVYMDKKCIDHDHKTKKIRGVLCNNCNTALGLFDDNIKIMKDAIQYLEQAKQLA